MYSLLVSGEVEDDLQSAYRIHRSRFLEYTPDSIKAQLRPLPDEARDCIKSWPCILMQEGRAEEIAHLVQITNVEIVGEEVKLNVARLPKNPKMLNAAIWKIRADLDIEQFEFNRTHFAVKDRDLLGILSANEYSFEEALVSRFGNRPLPAPPRSALIAAIDVLAARGHADIDRFLLEAGLDRLDVPRSFGSRQERAQAIIDFALKNPSATTADNHLFSSFILARTNPMVDPGSPLEPVANESTIEARAEKAVPTTLGSSPNRVFVVHGRNESARTAIVSFLSSVGLEGIVLHDQPNMGRHLLTKFIDEAELVTFAIVLMTDDDIGGAKDGKQSPRARQNVILELGYFLSHLGQQKVCAIKTPGLETPSDFDGIVYISMGDDGRWKLELARELKAAGMPITEPAL